MATVVVNARFCDKVHRVTVTMRDDGDLDLHVESDCEHVMQYAENIGPVMTMADVTEREGGKVMDPEMQKPLTLTCLAPIAVLEAAWLELGMMSKNRAKQVGSDELDYRRLDD
ncbi:MAG: DUF6951 family protein [Candidatus Methanomethylophilaceae archaeon]